MALAPFFTLYELSSVLQQDLDTSTAEDLAALASDVVRDEIGQTITAVAGDVVTVYGDSSELLMLPQLPVTTVSAVSVAGLALTSAEFLWHERGQLYWVVTPGTSEVSPIWHVWQAAVPVTITYDHGYATIPNTVKSVALEVAMTLYSNPMQVISETVASYSVSYAARAGGIDVGGSSGFGLTKEQKRRLDPFRNPNI